METVIADAGPRVAYLKRDDKDHDWAAEVFHRLMSPLRTCDAALSEAFFLLQRTHGGADRLLELLERGLVIPDFSLVAELRAVGQLLRRYQSVPMSLADACLVRQQFSLWARSGRRVRAPGLQAGGFVESLR